MIVVEVYSAGPMRESWAGYASVQPSGERMVKAGGQGVSPWSDGIAVAGPCDARGAETQSL